MNSFIYYRSTNVWLTFKVPVFKVDNFEAWRLWVTVRYCVLLTLSVRCWQYYSACWLSTVRQGLNLRNSSESTIALRYTVNPTQYRPSVDRLPPNTVPNMFFLGYIWPPLPPFSKTAVFCQSRERRYWGARLYIQSTLSAYKSFMIGMNQKCI